MSAVLIFWRSSVKAQKGAMEFVLQEAVTLVPQSRESLSRALHLMEKYQDIPMDFGDATLVVLAEDTGIEEIFTLDVKGFSAYRIRGRKGFRLWPELQ
jgi:predicted nucleic acid-binding protein